jgi:hypothetical protein
MVRIKLTQAIAFILAAAAFAPAVALPVPSEGFSDLVLSGRSLKDNYSMWVYV